MNGAFAAIAREPRAADAVSPVAAVTELARRVAGAEAAMLFARDASGRYAVAHATVAMHASLQEAWFDFLRHAEQTPSLAERVPARLGPVMHFELMRREPRRGLPLGALVLVGRGRLAGEDARLLAAAAAPALQALGIEDLERRLRLRIYRLHTLFDMSRTLAPTSSPPQILRSLATTLMGQLMVTQVVVLKPDAERKETRLSVFPPDALEREARTGLERLRWQDVVHAARAATAASRAPILAALAAAGLRRIYPLVSGRSVVGVVAIGERGDRAGKARRAFPEEDDEFARTLTNHAAMALASAHLLRESVTKKRMERELELAKTIQEAIIPKGPMSRGALSISGEAIPCFEVGGDYLDTIPLPDGRLLLALGDVSGKGVPAAILMASIAATVRALAKGSPPESPGSLARLVEQLNELLLVTTSRSRFVSLILLTIHPDTGVVRYVNAGHNPGLIVGRDVLPLEATGVPLGLFKESAYEERETVLPPRAPMLLYTDGLSELLGSEPGACRELASWVRDTAGATSADEVCRKLLARLRRKLRGAHPHDDMTLLCVLRQPPGRAGARR